MNLQNFSKRLLSFLRQIPPANGLNIPLQGDGYFNVIPVFHGNILIGVNVTNLGNTPFLPMAVFSAAIELLLQSKDFRARKGNAIGARLGQNGLELNSVEGYVAYNVYNYELDDWVFQRIVPISRILQHSGVCINKRGYLKLIITP